MIHSRCLVDLGFRAIFGFGKQELGCLQNINTHIDPISWKKPCVYKRWDYLREYGKDTKNKKSEC